MISSVIKRGNTFVFTIPQIVSFRYGAVTPSNLWAVYENYYFDIEYKLSDNVPFTNFIQSWTDQSGYPVVNVTRNQNTYIITQVNIRLDQVLHWILL